MLRDPCTLDIFLGAIQSMTSLENLAIENFILPTPDFTPLPQICLSRGPIPIDTLCIQNTHGSSLSFLLEPFEPDELTLDSRWFIPHLPDCDRLTLRRIQTFVGFVEVLAGWDGDELVIDSCPFFDERFVGEWRQLMGTYDR
jgi:hypothetical protein